MLESVLYSSLPGSIPHRGGGGPGVGGTLGPWPETEGPPGPEIGRPPHRQICRWGEVRKRERWRKVELRCKQKKGKTKKKVKQHKRFFGQFCDAFCFLLFAVLYLAWTL